MIGSEMENSTLKIFLLPALGVDGNYYAPLIEGLKSELSADVSILSPPGPGTLGQRLTASVKVGYPEMVDEICSAVQQYKHEHPKHSVLLMGHSLGAHFAMLVAAKLGPMLRGVVLVAAGSPHWGAWPAQEQTRLRRGVRLINVLTTLLPWYPGEIVGFGGNQSRKLMRDWCRYATTGQLFALRGLGALRSTAGELTLPILTVYVQGDTLAPALATDQLLCDFGKISRTSATLHTDQLPDVPAQRRHFAWCRQPGPVCRMVASWMSDLQTIDNPKIPAPTH